MEEVKNKSLGKKILTVIITVFVTIIVLLMIVASWVLIKNPLNIRGVLLFKLGWIDKPVQMVPVNNQVVPETVKPVDSIDANSANVPIQSVAPVSTTALPMTNEQRAAVESFGIDPDSVVITPDMENCFLEKLGAERVNEIKAGATPGLLEMMKASSCL